jgi:ATP-dependent Lon protease
MKEKVIIANQYLLPRIREQVKFDAESITIPDESLQYIVDAHCCKEDGVRNLKRCLEIIYSKLNLYRLMKPGTNLFEQEISLKVEFPFVVTKDMVDKIVKLRKENETWKNLYN